MRIEKVREAADIYSGKLSDISRQLCFAGIAVVWVFKVGGDGTAGVAYNGNIAIPLGFFALSMCFDLVQYAYQTWVWTCLGNEMDKTKLTEKTVDEKINTPANFIFSFKVLFVLLGYVMLISNIAADI